MVPHTWLRSIPLTGASRAVRLVEPETTAQISMAIHAGSVEVPDPPNELEGVDPEPPHQQGGSPHSG